MSGPADYPPISLEEVEEAVGTLKLRKASGVNELPGEAREVSCEVLHRLVFEVWIVKELPEQWKETLIFPVYNKGIERSAGITMVSRS